jgi:hypothetical protein
VNPTPSPVDVLIHPGPAEWWQILGALGPLAVLLGAALAALIGWGTLRQRTAADALALAQKREADDRAEWWKRTQWALDQAVDEDADSKTLGLAALAVLAHSELARREELELLDIAWKAVNADGHEQGRQMSARTPERKEAHGARSASTPAAASGHRVRVAAARLRVTLDERLGRPTPPKAQALAREEDF